MVLPKQRMPQQAVSPRRHIAVAVAETGPHPVMKRRGVKSLAYDLATGQGVVFSRAASTLRSVETQPLIG